MTVFLLKVVNHNSFPQRNWKIWDKFRPEKNITIFSDLNYFKIRRRAFKPVSVHCIKVISATLYFSFFSFMSKSTSKFVFPLSPTMSCLKLSSVLGYRLGFLTGISLCMFCYTSRKSSSNSNSSHESICDYSWKRELIVGGRE